MFTRRAKKSRKKLILGDDEDEVEQIIFKRSTSMFEEGLSRIQSGVGMGDIKFLKYETRNKGEHKNIEEALVDKMEKLPRGTIKESS